MDPMVNAMQVLWRRRVKAATFVLEWVCTVQHLSQSGTTFVPRWVCTVSTCSRVAHRRTPPGLHASEQH